MSEGLINVLDIYFSVLTVIWDHACKDWFKIVSLMIECSPSALFVGSTFILQFSKSFWIMHVKIGLKLFH